MKELIKEFLKENGHVKSPNETIYFKSTEAKLIELLEKFYKTMLKKACQ